MRDEFVDIIAGNGNQDWWNSPSSLPLVAHSAEDLVVRSVANAKSHIPSKCIFEGIFDNMRFELFCV